MGRAHFSFIWTECLRAGLPAQPKYTYNYMGGSSEGVTSRTDGDMNRPTELGAGPELISVFL